MKKSFLLLPALLASLDADADGRQFLHQVDTLEFFRGFEPDTVYPFPVKVRLSEQSLRHWLQDLTEEDYKEVADELGVEVAAIKAVVDIETGGKHHGFNDDGSVLINFDLTIYRQRLSRCGLSISSACASAPEAFQSPNVRKYGTRQKAQWARLEAARKFDSDTANEGVFWGMFQIGGFNWKLCGCDSVDEFVELMSRSERDQLELFARFCNSRNLTRFIRAKDWDGFALRYNGPGYKSQGYDSKMAAAYKRFKK